MIKPVLADVISNGTGQRVGLSLPRMYYDYVSSLIQIISPS